MADTKVKKRAVTVNMSDELYSEINTIAEDREHSLSHVARRFIEDAIKTKKEEGFKSKLIDKGVK